MHPLAQAWQERGRLVPGPVGDVFVVDEPAIREPDGPPILLIHGFPTCSFDWHRVWEDLRASRRVVAMDLPGYGLSAKPDLPYPLELQADAVVAVAAATGLGEVDLVTHDMGDTVGGLLLARDLDGRLPFAVRRRVVTNGSIYLAMASLRWQQRLLERLPNRSLPIDLPSVMYTRGLARLFGTTPAPPDDLAALWDLFRHAQGNRRITRLIRYLDDRRSHEDTWTGAIETHPAPLAIVWGDADSVAVPGMATRLHGARPDAALTWLPGVGHFPMTEAPGALADATLDHLGG